MQPITYRASGIINRQFLGLYAKKTYISGVNFLCIILSFYVILLSVKPCCTNDSCNQQTTVKEYPQKNAVDDDCSSCSPFYRCGNCAGFIALMQETQNLLIAESAHFTGTIYKQTYLQQVPLAIWQPPRLS
ncbi:hypothetical protein DJ568_10960 [Mucilaginibacter hurinus]|uniref:Uncharacterized protein n=1 Tax=Mucilaginibacter hurinus TaxID=2201324 RepID=A0A367GPJ5_9SPHI|nr:DUF6660 family protein [Mucilaginibacter hurinus]RCH54985.1 hypothetical protein DJ568_10960 [Mucilaginibacter hurinus]